MKHVLVAAIAALSISGVARAADLVSNDPEAFARVLHKANQSEIELGELAQQKGEDPRVKDVGRMMVSDHQKADEDLMAFAKQKGWKLAAEPKPSNELQKALHRASEATTAKLKALSGPTFDTAYLAAMVDDHDLDITAVGRAAKKFQASDFGKKLEGLLPTLQQHRNHAYQALGEVKAKPELTGVGGAGRDDDGANSPHTNPMQKPVHEAPERPANP